MALMAQLKARCHPEAPPAIATDGKGRSDGRECLNTQAGGDRRGVSKPNPIGTTSRWSSIGPETTCRAHASNLPADERKAGA